VKKISKKPVKGNAKKRPNPVWEEQTGEGEIWQYQELKPGASITGILTSMFSFKGKFGPRKGVNIIEENTGERYTVFLCASLDRKLSGVPIPSRILITYTGTRKDKGKQAAYQFTVQRDSSYIPETSEENGQETTDKF